ncbi:MAG: DUF1016 N-terminal domain-containing protein [Nitrospirota bacterium]
MTTKDLQKEFSGIQGFSARNFWNMRQFYTAYKNNTKLQPLVGEISWTKNVIIMQRCKDDIQREFYIRITKKFGWTKDVLVNQLEAGAFERYMANQTNFDKAVPEKYRHQAKLAVKDEYSFDFLDLGEENLRKIGLNERQIKVVMYVKEKGRIANKEYQELCDVSRQTAARELLHMTKLKMFMRHGKIGRDAYYALAGKATGNINASQTTQMSMETKKGVSIN